MHQSCRLSLISDMPSTGVIALMDVPFVVLLAVVVQIADIADCISGRGGGCMGVQGQQLDSIGPGLWWSMKFPVLLL